MNNARRKELARATSLLEALKDQLEEAKTIIENCRDEEQEYIDNLPENLQSSERAQLAENAVNAMDNAIEAIPDLDEVIGYIEEGCV